MKINSLKHIKVKPIWFDSMGAKSSSVFIETPDVKILIDPGASAMQPSYPLPNDIKWLLNKMAYNEIEKYAKKADITVITHYHYDHHTLPSDTIINTNTLYKNKVILVKDPNKYINNSQWERARIFFEELYSKFGNIEKFEEYLEEPKEVKFSDPMERLPLAKGKNYGNYADRKKELLDKGYKWFEKLMAKWNSSEWIPEIKTEAIDVRFADEKTFTFRNTKIRFSEPLFHGLEFDRVGWIIALTIEYGREKILFSSDVQGPEIEDYADWMIKENPDFLILDGPPTYLFGYMLNRINLQRAIDNACKIIRETKTKIIIYDHHLLRDPHYRKRVDEVYRVAEKEGKMVVTAAEFYGEKPMIEKAIEWKNKPDEINRLKEKLEQKIVEN